MLLIARFVLVAALVVGCKSTSQQASLNESAVDPSMSAAFGDTVKQVEAGMNHRNGDNTWDKKYFGQIGAISKDGFGFIAVYENDRNYKNTFFPVSATTVGMNEFTRTDGGWMATTKSATAPAAELMGFVRRSHFNGTLADGRQTDPAVEKMWQRELDTQTAALQSWFAAANAGAGASAPRPSGTDGDVKGVCSRKNGEGLHDNTTANCQPMSSAACEQLAASDTAHSYKFCASLMHCRNLDQVNDCWSQHP